MSPIARFFSCLPCIFLIFRWARPLRFVFPLRALTWVPGYDSMGLGLGFYDELVVERIESGLEFELSGEGSADVPRDESHLVLQAMKAGLRRLVWMSCRR